MSNDENTTRSVRFNPQVRVQVNSDYTKRDLQKIKATLFQTDDDYNRARKEARKERSSKPTDDLLKEAQEIVKGYKKSVIGRSEIGIDPTPSQMNAQDTVDKENFEGAFNLRLEANKDYGIDTEKAMKMARQPQTKEDAQRAVETTQAIAEFAKSFAKGVKKAKLPTLPTRRGGFANMVSDQRGQYKEPGI